MPKDRLYTAFHETFSLNLSAVASILNLSFDKNGDITPGVIRQETALGTNYIKAMPRYARGCGLLEMGNYQLTPFGEVVCQHDPNLSHPSTLWLMHYHLSAPHGPGPAFWSHLVTNSLPFDEEISRGELTAQLARFLESQSGTASPQDRTVRSTVTVFLGTYTKSDGLGRLGLWR